MIIGERELLSDQLVKLRNIFAVAAVVVHSFQLV